MPLLLTRLGARVQREQWSLRRSSTMGHPWYAHRTKSRAHTVTVGLPMSWPCLV